jgi:hypothetical protein
LLGRPPFVGDVADVLARVRAGQFPPPRSVDRSVDRPLEAVCLKAMARQLVALGLRWALRAFDHG